MTNIVNNYSKQLQEKTIVNNYSKHNYRKQLYEQAI